MYYIFPFHLVDPDSKIIIYGAGGAGRNYLNQIKSISYCQVLCLVDKDFDKIELPGIEIVPPAKLCNYIYDFIVISQIDDEVRESIKNELVERYHIDVKKVINYHARQLDWCNPLKYYETQKEEYESTKYLNDYLKEMNAKLLVTYRRIDICVRYLLFRDFVNGVENRKHVSLYSRYVLARGGGKEAEAFHSGKGKNSIMEFIEQGRLLCKNMEEEGFQKEHFVPLGLRNRPYDGLHRIAAAMVLNEKVWVHEYHDRPMVEVTIDWFAENGFTQEDRIRILRAYTDTYAGKCGIFLMYAPVEDLWTYMERQISKIFTVVGKIDYDFTNNFIAFENITRQIYSDWDQYSEWLTRKLDILALSSLKYRVLLVSDEETENKDFFKNMRNFKLDLRQHLFMDIADQIPIIIHASDTEEEFYHLRNLFLSANNIKWLKHNMRQYYRGWFLEQIGQIKTWCTQNDIDIEKICVVGSAVMELYGIRDAHNFNIILSGVEVKRIKNIPHTLELIHMDYCLDEKNNQIKNRTVIEDDNYHTVFADLKFCNLDFVYRYKVMRKSEKDVLDIAKIQSWFHFATNFDNKDELQKQIRRELFKRGIEL